MVNCIKTSQKLGIALTGYDTFTKEQINSLKYLLICLQIKEIQPHHEKCPGKGLNIALIQAQIAQGRMIEGKASFYTNRSNTSKYTASGAIYRDSKLTCAMKHHNFGGVYRVTNLENGKSVEVLHNDFGTLKPDRAIDLSAEAFRRIGSLNTGILNVRIEKIN
jgi:rare lipoprotein A